jgi:hypothetical protein
MQNNQKVERDFLAECTEDYVGLWSLIQRIRFDLKESDPQRIRDTTIELITQLLRKGLIKAGIPRITGEFEEWQLSPEESMQRIESEWDELGGEPDMGDIVWFTSTAEGDLYAREKGWI